MLSFLHRRPIRGTRAHLHPLGFNLESFGGQKLLWGVEANMPLTIPLVTNKGIYFLYFLFICHTYSCNPVVQSIRGSQLRSTFQQLHVCLQPTSVLSFLLPTSPAM